MYCMEHSHDTIIMIYYTLQISDDVAMLQVINYGIGGQYEPHLDVYEVSRY